MTWSYAAAGAATVCYGVGSVLQALGARRTARGALEFGLLVRLVRELPYLAGLALDLAGFALTVVALRSLPLFLVQSVVAANVGVTAVAAILVFMARLRTSEIVALLMLASGLMLLALSAQPGHAHPLPEWVQWLLLGLLPALVACALSATRPWWHAVSAPAGWAIVGFGGSQWSHSRPRCNGDLSRLWLRL